MDLKFCRERASIVSRRERGRTPFADGASVACLREIAAYFRWTSHPFCLRAGGGEGAGAGRGRQRRGRRERRGRDDARLLGRVPFVPPNNGDDTARRERFARVPGTPETTPRATTRRRRRPRDGAHRPIVSSLSRMSNARSSAPPSFSCTRRATTVDADAMAPLPKWLRVFRDRARRCGGPPSSGDARARCDARALRARGRERRDAKTREECVRACDGVSRDLPRGE